MSHGDHVAEHDQPTTMSGWYGTNRLHLYMETRQVGDLTMFEFFQPAGSFDKPAMDLFLLQIALHCDGPCRLDLGGERAIVDQPAPGAMVLSVPGTRTSYDLPVETHGLALELDAALVRDTASEIAPRFEGHFDHLHSSMWRDHRLRDDLLRLWRAGKGDPNAPPVDPDTAVLVLTQRLLALAEPSRRPDERAVSMAPHVLRRVLDYVEANLDGDCRLFALAAVAGLSPYHFARAFRNDMADPPHRYVQGRRLQRALEQVRGTALDLAEIAQNCGFSSQSRMTSAFARQFGVTPGRLRQDPDGRRPALYLPVTPPGGLGAEDDAPA